MKSDDEIGRWLAQRCYEGGDFPHRWEGHWHANRDEWRRTGQALLDFAGDRAQLAQLHARLNAVADEWEQRGEGYCADDIRAALRRT